MQKYKVYGLALAVTGLLGGVLASAKTAAALDMTTPVVPYNVEYFSNKTLAEPAVLTRTEASVYYHWNHGSPHPSVPVNNFSARWVTNEHFNAGNYRFYTGSDDGVRLYIDGALVIENWDDHAYEENSKDVALTEGIHNIKLEYYENNGSASAKLSWKFLNNKVETDYAAKFWNYPASQVPAIPNTPPLFQANYPKIEFNWEAGSPSPLVAPEYFISQFKANKKFEKGNYQFVVNVDDGVRLWVDDELIIDEWNDNATVAYLGVKKLEKGLHKIRLEHFERGGGANVKLTWNKIEGEYSKFNTKCYNNLDLTGSPVLTRQDKFVSFNFGLGSPAPVVNVDNFSCSFAKNQTYAAGDHKFLITADDGFRFYIDGVKVFDKWYDGVVQTFTVNKNLTAGSHNIKLEFYERGGGAQVTLVEQ